MCHYNEWHPACSADLRLVQTNLMILDKLTNNQPVRIANVDWSCFPEAEGRRLRALGIDVGEEVTIRQRGVFFGRDPIALEIGRVTVAIRRKHALAITVEPLAPSTTSDETP